MTNFPSIVVGTALVYLSIQMLRAALSPIQRIIWAFLSFGLSIIVFETVFQIQTIMHFSIIISLVIITIFGAIHAMTNDIV